jgi:hypothetical protein
VTLLLTVALTLCRGAVGVGLRTRLRGTDLDPVTSTAKFLTERLELSNLPSRTHSVPTQLHIRGSTGLNPDSV